MLYEGYSNAHTKVSLYCDSKYYNPYEILAIRGTRKLVTQYTIAIPNILISHKKVSLYWSTHW